MIKIAATIFILVLFFVVLGAIGMVHDILWKNGVPVGSPVTRTEVLSELQIAGYSPIFEGMSKSKDCERYSIISSPSMVSNIKTYYYFSKDTLSEMSGRLWK